LNELLVGAASLGFVLGMRHALDADHVAAVSTIVSEQRGLRGSTLVGGFWGLGHAMALLGAGGLLLAWRLQIPERVASLLEAGVAVMLVLLGVLAIRRAARGLRLHAHRHVHDGREHVHIHAHRESEAHAPHKPDAHHEGAHDHGHALGVGFRPLVVGMVHGLAGSAAPALLVMGAAPSWFAGLTYLAALAVGSAIGMALLSALMSLPLQLLAARYQMLQLRVQLLAGACSLAVGLLLFGRHVMSLA
jgi:ABC-type nickel/cobalt efflux system permease component RcnA